MFSILDDALDETASALRRTYLSLLRQAYAIFALPSLSPQRCHEELQATITSADLTQLLTSFEEDFIRTFYKYSWPSPEYFRWLYFDQPNNLMIEAFAATGGRTNSALFYHSLRQPAVCAFLKSISFSDLGQVHIQVPFCGNGLEIKGLIWALRDLFPHIALAVHLSDINAQSLANAQMLYSDFPLPSIRAPNLVRAKFSRIDLVNSELPGADLVIAVHPQLFEAGRTFASDRWISIIKNVAKNSHHIIFFLIAPLEAQAIIKLLCGTHSIKSLNNPHSFTMPREVISNARAARRGDPNTIRHRYYNTILLAKRTQG